MVGSKPRRLGEMHLGLRQPVHRGRHAPREVVIHRGAFVRIPEMMKDAIRECGLSDDLLVGIIAGLDE